MRDMQLTAALKLLYTPQGWTQVLAWAYTRHSLLRWAGVMPLMEMRARRQAQLSGQSTPTRTGSPRPTQDSPASQHVEVSS